MSKCKRGHAMTPENTYVHPKHGRRSCKVCRRMPAHLRRPDRHPLETLVTVSNEPLRDRFLLLRERGDVTATTVAIKLGWRARSRRNKGEEIRERPDTVRVLRTLGVAKRTGDEPALGRVSYEIGVQIAHALGMEPHEAGV